jgi:stearoyl-CoA desaturase (delta-9 desaturase)
MVIIIFFIVHWYLSLFSQTFLMHRYAAHGSFTMNKFWERFFYIFAYITMGSSYLSPRSYAILHRMHHAFADTKKDPHSPKNFRHVFAMMDYTAKIYSDINGKRIQVSKRFTKNLPQWSGMDKWGQSIVSRLLWGGIYIAFFILFANHWWQYLFLPIVMLMSPVHGAIINWFAHKYGYRNFNVKNTSRNLFPIDFFMLGERYHNNHHKYASRINFGIKWFEIDPVYYIILFLNWLGIVRIKKLTTIAEVGSLDKEGD